MSAGRGRNLVAFGVPDALHRRSPASILGRGGIAVVVALSVVVSLPGFAGAHTLTAAPLSSHTAPLPVRHHHPPGLAAKIHPAQGGDWYTQEGATLSQLNNSTASGVPKVFETFTLATSPHSTAYELNALSDTGDWYQIVIADNWPGCNTGFEEATEIWDSFGNSGPVNCDATLTLSSGDTVEFGIGFDAQQEACLSLTDLTTAKSHSLCYAQPDSGGSQLEFLTSGSNPTGYYTGPMTETLNLTADACPAYRDMPTMGYTYPGGFFITTYVAWSDEFDAFSGTLCWQTFLAGQTLLPGQVSTVYVDTAQGTGYGPVWGGGQNLSLLDATKGFRYQTDPKPIALNVSASATTVYEGTRINFTANLSGGVSPFVYSWFVNQTPLPGSGGSVSWIAATPGTYTIYVHAQDGLNDVGTSTGTAISVAGPIQIPRLALLPTRGNVDAGQSVTLTGTVVGGWGGYAYVWFGLPGGCLTTNSATLSCRPSQNGTFNITLQGTSNNTTALSPVATLTVFPDPTVAVAGSSADLDVRQPVTLTATVTGGAPGATFLWSGLPTSCGIPANASFVCTPLVPASYTVSTQVTDGDGGTASSATFSFLVRPAPGVSIAANRSVLDTGQSVQFVANVTGGAPGVSYAWTDSATSCTGDGTAMLICTSVTAGRISASVAIVDGHGVSATSQTLGIGVFPAVIAFIEPPSAVRLGDVMQLNGSFSEGAPGALQYSWAGLPPGCGPSHTTIVVCTPNATGSYTVQFTVVDGAGASSTANATVDISVPSTGGTGAAGPFSPLVILLVLVGVTALIAIVAAAGLRRRKSAPDEPADDQPYA